MWRALIVRALARCDGSMLRQARSTILKNQCMAGCVVGTYGGEYEGGKGWTESGSLWHNLHGEDTRPSSNSGQLWQHALLQQIGVVDHRCAFNCLSCYHQVVQVLAASPALQAAVVAELSMSDHLAAYVAIQMLLMPIP
jgi:hypothetical protein